MFNWLKNPFAAQKKEDGSFQPSPFTLFMATSNKTKYEKQNYDPKYTGNNPILVVCTDEKWLEMENKRKFSTGNHPVELFVPLLHFRDAGFDFEFATVNGESVKLEMWAFPNKDEHVKEIYEELKSKMEKPKKLADISSVKEYSGIFIPGGHGSMINLPYSNDLGRLLRQAHEQKMPTITLCHGPAALLSTGSNKDDAGKEFAYEGYDVVCFTDKTDKTTPKLGYMPGQLPWKLQETLKKNGVQIKNAKETGEVKKDRELISGDSPTAAQNLGKYATPILVDFARKHRI